MMAPLDKADLGRALNAVARSALATFCVVVCVSLTRAVVEHFLGGNGRPDWRLIFLLALSASVLVSIWVSVSVYFSLRSAGPAATILNRTPDLSISPDELMSGFVGMEYYGLILNRTYVVFVAQDGLYGWKAEGPVGAERKRFYESYQKMFDEPELMRDMGAIKDLSKLKGGFFIPGS